MNKDLVTHLAASQDQIPLGHQFVWYTSLQAAKTARAASNRTTVSKPKPPPPTVPAVSASGRRSTKGKSEQAAASKTVGYRCNQMLA